MAKTSLSGFGILLCAALILQTKTAVSQQSPPVTAPAAKYRAVLDQYCVTCHNDKTKRANLSLENVDPTTIGDHPEVWEKVIRKLRAGVMPPPGVRRPPLTDYEGLRDWLENEVDQKAAVRGVNPGYVVLHRLNRRSTRSRRASSRTIPTPTPACRSDSRRCTNALSETPAPHCWCCWARSDSFF